MKKLAIILMLLASNGAAAQDQKTIRALNNLHDEMLACIAYYTIGHACTKDQVPPEITESTAVAIKSLTEGSYEIGQMLGMTDDAMTSRLRMHADESMARHHSECIVRSRLTPRELANYLREYGRARPELHGSSVQHAIDSYLDALCGRPPN